MTTDKPTPPQHPPMEKNVDAARLSDTHSRSRSPPRRHDRWSHPRLYDGPSSNPSNDKGSGSYRSEDKNRDGRARDIYEWDRQHCDREREYGRSRHIPDRDRERGRPSARAVHPRKGTVVLRIRTTDGDLPHVLPISRVQTYSDLERTIETLLRELLNSGDIQQGAAPYVPLPRSWKITDTSGAIINKIFWEDMCEDAASFILTRCTRSMANHRDDGGKTAAKDLIMSKKVDSVLKSETSPPMRPATTVKEKLPECGPRPRAASNAEPASQSAGSSTKHAGVDASMRKFSPPLSKCKEEQTSPESSSGQTPTRSIPVATTTTPPRPRPFPHGNRSRFYPPRIINIIVRNPDFSYRSNFRVNSNMSIADFMSNILRCQPNERIQHLVYTNNKEAPFHLSLTYMYGTRKLLRELPAASLNWDWEANPDIEVVLLPAPSQRDKVTRFVEMVLNSYTPSAPSAGGSVNGVSKAEGAGNASCPPSMFSMEQ
ncbi:hypothetical protein EX30DRAFT_399358 [Ascodesmis nigricans]|uniref:Uncharacterized protein n=1 Tax=Ascodesmis nigricans TaxID=341454 RepID=A0A4S2MP86_9PEZI|nr:hypothetical protein EX30DRAFT_399358 [Ascodesmis nigricans]